MKGQYLLALALAFAVLLGACLATPAPNVPRPSMSLTSDQIQAFADAGASAASPTPSPTASPTPDPEPAVYNKTRSVGFLAVAIPGIALAFFGYYWVGITVFLGGFIVAGVLFYVFSPRIFQHTPFCCGENGTLLGHVIVSLVVGLFGGLLTRCLFRVGIFAVGLCLGLLSAVLLLCTPLKDESAMQSDGALAGFYIGMMLAGGILTTCLPRFFIILTTSFGGGVCFFFGVDYFVESNFGAVVLYALHRIGEAVKNDFAHGHSAVTFDRNINDKALFMIAGWIAFSLIGFITQYYLASKREDSVTIYIKKSKRYRSNEVEMNQRLVRS